MHPHCLPTRHGAQPMEDKLEKEEIGITKKTERENMDGVGKGYGWVGV